jgi:hypothetical protein
VVEYFHLMVSKEIAREGCRTRQGPQEHAPSDILLVTRSHLLKVRAF